MIREQSSPAPHSLCNGTRADIDLPFSKTLSHLSRSRQPKNLGRSGSRHGVCVLEMLVREECNEEKYVSPQTVVPRLQFALCRITLLFTTLVYIIHVEVILDSCLNSVPLTDIMH